MLIPITHYNDLDARKLMDIYSESNYKNTDYFYTHIRDTNEAIRKVEENFLDYLKERFFKLDEPVYWVLEKDGMWVSALRVSKIQTALYYLEALETRPDKREKGYATLLLSGVVDSLKKRGPFLLCDCVSKQNSASLHVHQRCGFQIVSDEGYNYLNEKASNHHFGLQYIYEG